MKEEIAKKIQETNQKYLGKLVNQEIPQKLEKQLKDMDWSYLDLIHRKKHERGTFEPLKATEISEIKQRETEFRKAGLDAIRAGKVGAILLAGGQGTRLGFDKAKGMFNIGVNRTLYIFEQLIANLMDVTNEAGTWIPLYIMTSDKNDEQTRAFFGEHNYFGYNKDYVKFFVQEMVPAVDFEGNVLREAEDSLAMSPNGNGGWYKSLLRAGLDQDIRKRGVEWSVQRFFPDVYAGQKSCAKFPHMNVSVQCALRMESLRLWNIMSSQTRWQRQGTRMEPYYTDSALF